MYLQNRQMCAAKYLHSSRPFRNDVSCTTLLQSRPGAEIESEQLAQQFKWMSFFSDKGRNVDDSCQQYTQQSIQNGKTLSINTYKNGTSGQWIEMASKLTDRLQTQCMLLCLISSIMMQLSHSDTILQTLKTNKYQLSQTNRHNALHHGKRAANKGGCSVW